MYNSLYLLIPNSQFIPTTTSTSAATSPFSISVSRFVFHRSFCLCHILDFTFKQYHMVFVFLWVTSFSIIISVSIHVVAKSIISYFFMTVVFYCGLPPWLSSKESTCNAGVAGDAGSIPGLGRSSGGGHVNLLQDSCLENPMDRGAWRATVHRISKSQVWLKQLNTHTYTVFYSIYVPHFYPFICQ